MGRIPEFQRSRLVSSVVGTAGVDYSHEPVLEQARRMGKVAEEKIFEMQAKRNQAVDSAEVSKLILGFERDIDRNIIEKQSSDTYLDHPDDIFEPFLEEAQEMATAGLSLASNDRVKTSFANMQQQVIRNRGLSLQKWASEVKVVKAAGDLTESVNILSSAAYQTNNLEDIIGPEGCFDRLNQTLPTARAVYGAKADTEYLQEGREAIAKGFLYGQIQRNPLLAKHILDKTPEFKGIFSAGELKKLNSDISTAINTSDKRNKLNVLVEGYAENKELADKYASGELEVVDIDSHIMGLEENIDEVKRQVAGGRIGMETSITGYEGRIKYADNMRKMILSGADFDAVRDAKTLNSFYDEYNRIWDKSAKSVAVDVFEDIVRFQTRAAEMASQKLLPKAEFLQITNQLSNVLSNGGGPVGFKGDPAGPKMGFFGLRDIHKADDRPVDSFHNGYKRIWSWFENDKSEGWEQRKTDALYFYIEKYDKFNKAKGEELTYEEADNIALTELNMQIQKENPKYSMEDLEFTASETGLSIQEIIKALRIKEGR